MKAFLNLNSCFSAFLSCLHPYSYRALSVESGSNLNSWPVLSVSPPWGGETVRLTDGKTAKTEPTQSTYCHRFVWPSEGFWRKSQQLLSGLWLKLLWSRLLNIRFHDPAHHCVVYCSNESRNLCFFFFFVDWCSGKVEKSTMSGLHETNLDCNNIPGLFGRWFGGFFFSTEC